MRRFKIPVGVIVCLALWALALCVPTVRELPSSFVLLSWTNRVDGKADVQTVAKLARQFPKETTGVVWAAQNAYQFGDKEALDKVALRFPGDMKLRASQLKLSESGLILLRMDKMRASADAKQRTRWLKLAQIARDSARLEPDNAFWPWMEAAFYYAARRDEAALDAMQRAGTCARYQDYSAQISADRIAFLERHRPLAWETKISVLSATLYPQLAWINQATHLATLQARQLRVNGQTQRALSAEASILSASYLLRRDGDSILTALNGEAIARESLRTFFGITKPKNIPPEWAESWGGPYYIDPSNHYQNLARTWSDFARGNGQTALAKRAEFVEDTSLQEQAATYIGGGIWQILGLSQWQGTAVSLAPVVLLLVAIATGTGALLWSLGVPLCSSGESPPRGQAIACANFSFWLLAGTMAITGAVYLRALDPFSGVELLRESAVTFVFLAMCATIGLLPVWFFNWKHKRRSGRRPDEKPQAGWKHWAPFLLWFVFAVSVIPLASNSLDGAPFFGDLPLSFVVAVSALAALFFSWSNGNTRSRWKWLLAHRSLGILLVAWSLVFLLLALAVWPLRAQLNRGLDRQLQIGEIAWMREQITESKQP